MSIVNFFKLLIFSEDKVNYTQNLFRKFQVKTIKVCRNLQVFFRVLKICLYEKVKIEVKKEYSVDSLDEIV